MRSRAWIVLLVISLGVNIGFLLHWAWPRIAAGREPAPAAGWHAGPMRRHLGLDPKQARRMEGERRQVLARVKPLQEDLRQKRRGLFMLMKGREVSEADLDATLGEISRLQAAIEKIFVLHALKVRGIFSPAQLRKYEGFLERGLCPGMLSGDSCPPGRARDRAKGRANGDAGTKSDSRSNRKTQ